MDSHSLLFFNNKMGKNILKTEFCVSQVESPAAMMSHYFKLLVNSQNPVVTMNETALPGACPKDSPKGQRFLSTF